MPDVVRLVATCAPGKRVTVFVGGRAYELPLEAKPAPAEPPHPLELVSKELRARDAEISELMIAVSARSDEAVNAMKQAVDAVAAGQERVVQSVDENTRTLHLPVKPVYDKAGKLKHAQRVKGG